MKSLADARVSLIEELRDSVEELRDSVEELRDSVPFRAPRFLGMAKMSIPVSSTLWPDSVRVNQYRMGAS